MNRNGINYLQNIDDAAYELQNALSRDKIRIMRSNDIEYTKKYLHEIIYLRDDIDYYCNSIELYCRALKDKLENE